MTGIFPNHYSHRKNYTKLTGVTLALSIMSSLAIVPAFCESGKSMTNQEQNRLYEGKLTAKLKQNWEPVSNIAKQTVSVIYKVSSDGNVSGISLQKSSGMARFDIAAIDTVKKSAPFDSYNGSNELTVVSNWTGNDKIETHCF